MINVWDFRQWVATLDNHNNVAVDDGGLNIVELDREGKETGAYYEVGGIPLKEEVSTPSA